MEKHEMMSLEDSGQLRDKMRFFEQELLKNHHIDPNLYVEYNVKRGLRDSAGKGVLTGLTEISDVNGYNLINGRQIPADGRLYYQGINVQDIISGLNGRRFGFEETIYLLIFGKLPDKEELSRFLDMMSDMEELGGRFVRDVVMKGTNANIMNAMQRCVLALYTYDDNPEDISPENVLRQSLELIAKLPEIAVYSYHAYRHFRKDDTLFIRNPQKGLSLAENILLMLRPDGKYTELEAKVLKVNDGEGMAALSYKRLAADKGLKRLKKALLEIDKELKKNGNICNDDPDENVYSRHAKQVMPVFKAMDGEKEAVPLKESCGRICGEFAYIYPPGIPLLAPGEQITEEILKTLQDYIEKNLPVQGLEDTDLVTIQVMALSGGRSV